MDHNPEPAASPSGPQMNPFMLLFDKRLPLWTKIPALLGLIYWISPFDLLPGWIPVCGWMDDATAVGVGFFLLWMLGRKFLQPPES